MHFGVVGQNQVGLIVLAAAVGFLGPGEMLQQLVKRRRRKIDRALPNALDLLVVCVESGLGLDQAILQVSREMQKSYPELSSEFAITNLEMRHGKRRADALRNLGDRTGVDDMKTLVSTLIQADRFGTSISQTLRTHSEFMRRQLGNAPRKRQPRWGSSWSSRYSFAFFPRCSWLPSDQ